MIEETLIREDGGMLILPFAYTFYASIVECYNELKQNFKIDFVSSDRNILCTVTNNITDSDVWEQLGNKDQFQENFYCTSLSEKVIRQNTADGSPLRTPMISLLNNIRNFESVRFICLELREDAGGYSDDTVNLKGLKAAHRQAKEKIKYNHSKRKKNQIEKKNEGQPTLGSSSNDTMAVFLSLIHI